MKVINSHRGGGYDVDAAAYFSAIATAGSSISTANKSAVDAFVVGCKSDGIWGAIKSCCLLAGPDDLTGALVPLVGSAPTNSGFVSGDYSRTTGLVGNGSSKYLDANRNNTADPQDSRHLALWVTSAGSGGSGAFGYIGTNSGASSHIAYNITTGEYFIRCSSTLFAASTAVRSTGLHAISRSSSTTVSTSIPAMASSVAIASVSPGSASINVFRRDGVAYSNARMSFYSIGESLNLTILNARLATYMAALA